VASLSLDLERGTTSARRNAVWIVEIKTPGNPISNPRYRCSDDFFYILGADIHTPFGQLFDEKIIIVSRAYPRTS